MERRTGNRNNKPKGKYVNIGSLLKGESKYGNKGSYLYAKVNVYCGKDQDGNPVNGALILKTVENGKPAYYEVKSMKVTDPTERQDSSFVKKNLSVNLLSDYHVEKLQEPGGKSSSKNAAKAQKNDDSLDSDDLLEDSEKEASDSADSDDDFDF